MHILDIGTGSGCILLSILKERMNFMGTGIDISKKSIKISKYNAKKLNLYKRSKFYISDIDNFLFGKYDVIVSNPPYIEDYALKYLDKEVIGFEPKKALKGGKDGLLEITKVINGASRLIKKNGLFVLEIGYNQMNKVVIATHNKDKQKEMEMLLSNFGINTVALNSFPKIGDIPETGTTLEENALIKARAVFSITGLASIADDTGLEIDALNGAPGVYTARFAGEGCSYTDNVKKIIEVMQGIPFDKRGAVFRTVIAYKDSKVELIAEGLVRGYISEKIKGLDGFGYDPVFYIKEKGKTFAEMKVEEKNIISHRGRATKALKERLIPILTNNSRKVGGPA